MSILKNRDEHFMKIAINEAKIAFEEDEIPVGAVIVHENQVIRRGIINQKDLMIQQRMQR